MRINFKSVTMQNFLSFGNKPVTVDFKPDTSYIVKGRNLDTDVGIEGESANGVGKTASFQAVVYAIYGKGVNDIKQDEFVNIVNKKGMIVDFRFNVGDIECQIIRKRKPSELQFIVGGEDVTRDSIANTNELIIDTIGINYETFILAFLMTTSVEPLLSRKPAAQRNFMEDLLGMNKLTERAVVLKRMRDDETVENKLLIKDMENLEHTNRLIKERFDNATKRYDDFESDRDHKKDTLEDYLENPLNAGITAEQLLDMEDDIQKAETELKKAASEVDEWREALSVSRSRYSKAKEDVHSLEVQIANAGSDIPHLEKSVSDVQTEIVSLESDLHEEQDMLDELTKFIKEKVEPLKKLNAEYDEESAELKHVQKRTERLRTSLTDSQSEYDHLSGGNCPYCNQRWKSDEQVQKLEKLSEAVAETNMELAKSEEELHKLVTLVDRIRSNIDDIDVSEAECEEAEGEMKATNNAIVRLESNIESKQNSLKKHQRDLEIAKNAAEDVDNLKNELEELSTHMDTVSADVAGDEGRLKKAQAAHEQAKSVMGELPVDSVREYNTIVSRIESALNDLESSKNAENPYAKEVEMGLEGFQEPQELESKLVSSDTRIKHINYLVKLLTDSKSFIRKNIIHRYVPFLNKQINKYCEKLQSPHVCEIQSDLTVVIEYMNTNVSYHSLSAGERLRLNVASSFALRDLLGMIGVKSDFLMVDELFDSALDTHGKREIFKTIKENYGSIMLISHTSEFDDKCDKRMTVVKDNGFSRIEMS